MRRRRLAFPTGKVARPLAVTDESQNAAYFLQPNWNGSIVHPPAHKQSRFQLARLAARATLPAREGKCALRAQDAHLYKSQFAEVSLVEGPSGSCTLCPTSVTHLLSAMPTNPNLFHAFTEQGALENRKNLPVIQKTPEELWILRAFAILLCGYRLVGGGILRFTGFPFFRTCLWTAAS